MTKTWTEIPITIENKKELKELKGSRTWEEFLFSVVRSKNEVQS